MRTQSCRLGAALLLLLSGVNSAAEELIAEFQGLGVSFDIPVPDGGHLG